MGKLVGYLMGLAVAAASLITAIEGVTSFDTFLIVAIIFTVGVARDDND